MKRGDLTVITDRVGVQMALCRRWEGALGTRWSLIGFGRIGRVLGWCWRGERAYSVSSYKV